jgi:hypothetical protein
MSKMIPIFTTLIAICAIVFFPMSQVALHTKNTATALVLLIASNALKLKFATALIIT